MALAFGASKGSAQKDKADQYSIRDGENRVRMVGDILARYVYWIKGENDKPIPAECLAFNRNTERFDNAQKDWVKEFYPDLKCTWAYAIQVIDPADGKLKVWNLKKKLLESIKSAAEDLGDPTEFETGWDVVFDKKKTGPLPINVAYELKVLRCKKRPLTEAERELVADLKSMDEILPRPTVDTQKTLLDKIHAGSTESIDEAIGEEFEVK